VPALLELRGLLDPAAPFSDVLIPKLDLLGELGRSSSFYQAPLLMPLSPSQQPPRATVPPPSYGAAMTQAACSPAAAVFPPGMLQQQQQQQQQQYVTVQFVAPDGQVATMLVPTSALQPVAPPVLQPLALMSGGAAIPPQSTPLPLDHQQALRQQMIQHQHQTFQHQSPPAFVNGQQQQQQPVAAVEELQRQLLQLQQQQAQMHALVAQQQLQLQLDAAKKQQAMP
jgi:hypothetical protein